MPHTPPVLIVGPWVRDRYAYDPRPIGRKTAAQIAVLTVAVSALSGCAMPASTLDTSSAPPPINAPRVIDLPIRDRDPVGYDRDYFGLRWADTDRNGCDTRNDVLRRDLADVRLDPRTDGCVVLGGTLTDPYGGQVMPFVRGPDSADVQVDHVVSLADGWRSGANLWTADEREAFANDPTNLLATDGRTNRAKGDRTADEWTASTPAGVCRYATIVVAVKTLYGLTVSEPERAALADDLITCPT